MTRAQSTESELLAAVRKAARQEQFLEVMSAEDARRRFENNLNLSPLPGERVSLAASLGRVLANDVIAPIDVPPAELTSVVKESMTDNVQLPRLYLTWLTPKQYAPGDAELDVVAAVLGGGKTSRLYKRLVYDMQIAQDVEVTQDSLGLGSVFMVSATAKPGVELAKIEAVIDDELAAIQKEGPAEEELLRARNIIETRTLSSLETLGGGDGVADRLNLYNHYIHDPDFLRNIGGSPYYNINSTYTDGAGKAIVNAVSYQQFWANNTSVPANGTTVTDAQMVAMLQSGFTGGKLTYAPGTLYLIFTAGKVNLGGGFGSQYCAYHTNGKVTINGVSQTVLYAAMPYDAAYLSGCAGITASANGDLGADVEVNTLAHEIEETTTDMPFFGVSPLVKPERIVTLTMSRSFFDLP